MGPGVDCEELKEAHDWDGVVGQDIFRLEPSTPGPYEMQGSEFLYFKKLKALIISE